MMTQHRLALLAFATMQSMRDATVTSVLIARVDQLCNVDRDQPIMPMSISRGKNTGRISNFSRRLRSISAPRFSQCAKLASPVRGAVGCAILPRAISSATNGSAGTMGAIHRTTGATPLSRTSFGRAALGVAAKVENSGVDRGPEVLSKRPLNRLVAGSRSGRPHRLPPLVISLSY
jgi:hypothetical protein